jgi:3-hydroxyacyl-CoA dehydrogenase
MQAKKGHEMTNEIQKIAVIGSGVMGSGIAALCANAGLDVVLLDIVPKDATDRDILAKSAIEKQTKGMAAGFTHKRNAKRVKAGNLEDHLDWLKDADLIIEVVLEKLEIKHAVYKQIDAVRKKGSIVSSNTSTLPLHLLTKGMPDSFTRDFMITHFFNPPRFMRLLEMLPSPTMPAETYQRMAQFGDEVLGKGVVLCKDTPGFLANRIGIYWMTTGLVDAIEMNIPVEAADAVMGKPLGIPKTGLFALYDLIGIDLMPLIAQAMLATLPEKDAFRDSYALPELVEKMIADGYTGRKGKGGFYKLEKDAKGKKTKLAINLKTGEYHPATKPKLASVSAAKAGLAALFAHDDIGGKFAASVMIKTLHYAASLAGEISDDIDAIDQAMQLGYNWKYGPFAMIDRLQTADASGTENFAKFCEKMGLDVPPIIEKARGKTLYDERDDARYQFLPKGDYAAIKRPAGNLMLADIKRNAKPVAKNASAEVWDLGEGIACLSLKSKMNTWDPENLKMVQQLPDIVQSGFKGLVIATDIDHFSFGANIGYFMLACNTASWWAISDMIRQGQQAFMGLKYAPFPVVASLSGMALGGGCELLLHCDAVQAHMESYPGLVEAGIGVIPGWGGCKELLLRHTALADASSKAIMQGKAPKPFMPNGPMPAIAKAFEYISTAKVAGSADQARDMLILNAASRISMSRTRVLNDAKTHCLELAKNYAPPESPLIRLPGKSGHAALTMAVENFVSQGKATPHDAVVAGHLASVLTGGDTDITLEITEQNLLDLEHDHFMELVRTQPTQDRISHMLNTNKPLRN